MSNAVTFIDQKFAVKNSCTTTIYSPSPREGTKQLLPTPQRAPARVSCLALIFNLNTVRMTILHAKMLRDTTSLIPFFSVYPFFSIKSRFDTNLWLSGLDESQ